MSIAVCRRDEDTEYDRRFDGTISECQQCQKEILVEKGLESEEVKICIHCAAKYNPEIVLFVELPPDEYGCRSIAVGLKEVYEKDNFEWHKNGVWHNQKWVLARQE